MRKKKLLNLSAVLLGAIMCFCFNKVQANDSIFSDTKITRDNLQAIAQANVLDASITEKVLGISKNRESGNYYQWNVNTTGEGKTVWKIATYPSTTSNTANYDDLYYCLNVEKGFGLSNGDMAEGAKDRYNISYNMKSSSDKNNIFNSAEGYLGTNYNKILWILDNSYIPTKSSSYKTSTEYKNIMNKAGITIENEQWDLTEDDIEVVQQMAIWYYSNNTGYTSLPSLYVNGVQLSSILYETTEYGEQITGALKQSKANKLYQYFINNASDSYQASVPSLTLSNTSATVSENGNYYVAGPFTLSKSDVNVTDLTVKIGDTTLSSSDYIITSSVTSDSNITNYDNLTNFYVKILKTKVTSNATVNVNVTGTYNIKSLIYMTNTGATNQPVVLVKNESKTINANTSKDIQLISVTVEKKWDDNNNQDEIRPSSIKVALYEGNNKKYEQILSESNSWKYTWTGLLDGKTYKVDEVTVPEGYTKSINGTTITNKHIPLKPDLALRKYITSINGNTISSANSNYRVPNITTTKLDNGTETTAKYEHKKDPIEVTTGSEVIYNITVYNEGEKDARASQIIDQLPTGLHFEEILTSGYTANYNENTNRLAITKIGTNNLSAYTKNGILSSETVRVKCKVTAEAGEERQILTNIAWISEMKDAKNNVFTSDIDSQTIVSPNCNKDNMSNYQGNYEDGWYKGQQDDDDFDRITIAPVIPVTLNKTVNKVWNDENNEDEIRPNEVKVQLYKNVNNVETAVGDEIVLSGNRLTYTWENLPEKEGNNIIVYSVKEIDIPNGYQASYSSENYATVDTITITNTHTVAAPTGKYNVVLKKVDNLGNELSGATIKVNERSYTIGSENIATDVNINSVDDIILEYTLEETKAPDGYEKIDNKDIRVKLAVTKSGKNYTVTRATLVDENGNTITDNNLNIELDTTTNTITINIVNKPVEKEFDLALRKYIVAVNDKTIDRKPIVDTSTIPTTGTATYRHSKQPVSVQKGDVVTYAIRVYNEGELDGYVDEITDYLPDNLLPIIEGVEGIDSERYHNEIDFNAARLWEIESNDGKTIKTSITSKGNATGEDIYTTTERPQGQLLKAYNGGNELDSIAVEIKCLVANSTEILTGEYLTNIAEITDAEDENGKHWDGKDSELKNVDNSNRTDYKNNEALESTSNSYIEGQEDDDDFEKLVIEVYDLSLRKWISHISRNGVNVEYGASREPEVNTDTLVNNTSTTAVYTHKKDPVEVQKGDIVTYTIRVYNEGTLDGIAAEITEYIPTYLTFDPNDSLNQAYGWTLVDDYTNNGIGVLKTNYLNNTVLKAFSYKEGDTLDNTENYAKDLKINFVVNDRPTVDTIMTNTSEISVYQYADRTAAIDRDSGEQWEVGILDYGKALLKQELDDKYVSTGKMTTDARDALIEDLEKIFIDYKPDYTSSDYGLSAYMDSKGITGEIFIGSIKSDERIVNGTDKDVLDEMINTTYYVIADTSSNAEITSKYIEYIDYFFQSYKGIAANKDDLSDSNYYYVGQEDDDDFEKLKIVYFDLALRKFITNVDGTEYNNRIPEVDTSKIGTIDQETGKKITTATYTHTKDPVLLETGSVVTYTIRVYNEGTVSGYANEITDNIPDGLEFLPENEINSQYKWTMLDENGEITQDISKVSKITTNYLGTDIISAYQENNGAVILDYKDVKVAFKVTEPNNSDRIIINTAQISIDSNDDIDSIPGNDILTEDDIDREYVKVETFDLALKKWVTATKVTYNGKTKTTKTGFDENSNEIAKVDLVGKKLKKTTVKFVYNIKVTNEGQVAGYATEIKDYIPSGLKFVAADNKDWTLQKDGTVTTDKLKDTLLQPGQSEIVEITLTWKNSSTNMGVKTNWAEISADSGDDIDSTPDNYNKIEDDIDDAKVILSIKTGDVRTYIGLVFISIIILASGAVLIKKYVINK